MLRKKNQWLGMVGLDDLHLTAALQYSLSATDQPFFVHLEADRFAGLCRQDRFSSIVMASHSRAPAARTSSAMSAPARHNH
ncbi:hypothetical protein [Mesorhizobium sp. 113-1-2]|uniref:hypothetical protein n=1 Tax=Mesorhizobium sp. 113-1-2 TaxID=2744515 RepID=UPI0019281A99|nr:hypothetical protein [Mesorhizobium sp. 113-1-2]